MPRGRYNVLKRQCRKMVYDVYKFMSMEAEEGIQYGLKAIQQRTAAATGITKRTVQRIIKTANESGSNMITVFRTPGKKRSGKKKVTGIDSFDQGVIKRCIHHFHLTEKELPTLSQLLRKLKADINFEGSATSLRRILKDLGFQWKRTEDNRKILIEQTNIRLKRIEFLANITRYRAEGRPIIYTDESYVDSSHINSKSWSDGTKKGLKKNISKGQRIVIVHAGSEAGFLSNALLMFKAGTKTGDYHDNMNYDNYEKWIRTQLIPNLPEKSVVVVDNASYHNKLEDAAPISTSRKNEMESWLSARNIPFSSTMLKPQLYKLICLHKERFKKYHIDRILKENNHTVLRLPPYHPDLNPIEMAWATIKGYVARKNVTWNIGTIMQLIEEKVNSMGENEWSALCGKVKNIEEEYKKSDVVIDMLTEEIIIKVRENDDESDNETEEDRDSSDSENSTEDSDNDQNVPSSSREPVFIQGVLPL